MSGRTTDQAAEISGYTRPLDDDCSPLPVGTADAVARQMLRDDRDVSEWTGTDVLGLIMRMERRAAEEEQAARRAVLERETHLADELDAYAELRAQGLDNRQIAERMRVHVRTAERYGRRLAGGGQVA